MEQGYPGWSAGQRAAGAEDITVLIPTYNRIDLLLRTLRCLEGQSAAGFAVVIVDDGSTDDTAAQLAAFVPTSPLAITIRHQINAGPARARNHGLSLVRTPLVLMIGDDTWPDPDFVAAHLAFHRSHPAPQDAAIGHTRWCETLQVVTPFMRWLDMDGFQFSYRALLAGETPHWRHFYTSNLSAKMALLGPAPFDESFPAASMEDIEAGLRLEEETGMRLAFLPDAVVHHVHLMDYVGACRRARSIGRSMAIFQALWPDHRLRHRGPVKRAAMGVVTSAPMMAVMTKMAGWSADRRTPGRFVAKLLKLHLEIGRRTEERKGDLPAPRRIVRRDPAEPMFADPAPERSAA